MSPAEAAPAKDRFTSLDTLALVREIRSAGHLFIDKVFDVAPDTWEMTLRGAGKGKWALLLASGRYAALRRETGPHAEELGRLTKELRRHLSGTALTGVAEPRGERLLELEAGRGDSGHLRLIIEFFGKGNLLLVREDRILAVAHAQTWAHRAVRPGADYLPPPQHANPWMMGIAELEAALTRSRTDRVRTLAAQLGFGGPVAEEVLRRADVPAAEPAPQDVPRSPVPCIWRLGSWSRRSESHREATSTDETTSSSTSSRSLPVAGAKSQAYGKSGSTAFRMPRSSISPVSRRLWLRRRPTPSPNSGARRPAK